MKTVIIGEGLTDEAYVRDVPAGSPADAPVTGRTAADTAQTNRSFPDLRTAVRAHTGRLLAYSLPVGAENQV